MDPLTAIMIATTSVRELNKLIEYLIDRHQDELTVEEVQILKGESDALSVRIQAALQARLDGHTNPPGGVIE